MEAPSTRKWGKVEIAADLRNQINHDDYEEGDKLPTEEAMRETYGGVSRGTVRAALDILTGEGLLLSKRPHGHFVRGRRRMTHRPQSDLQVRPSDAPKDSFLTELAEEGREPAQTIAVEIVKELPKPVADRLKLPEGENAVVRRRVRSLEGEPFLTNDSYFPLSIAQGTDAMSPVDVARGINRVLADAGHVQVRATDEFIIRMPTPDEQHRLELAPGTPVAVQYTTGFDRNGKPLRVAETTLPGDRHIIVYERPGLPDPEVDEGQ